MSRPQGVIGRGDERDALYFVLVSGPLMLTPVPSPQAKSGP